MYYRMCITECVLECDCALDYRMCSVLYAHLDEVASVPNVFLITSIKDGTAEEHTMEALQGEHLFFFKHSILV
jgi:hypothetical protein